MSDNKRTIKTLLLCKFCSGHDDTKLIEKLNGVYHGESTSGGTYKNTIFATIGKVDAISLYDTGGCDSAKGDWLKHVAQDRKKIIHKSNSSVRYHPIHLIANDDYTENNSNGNCAIITLIYGVNIAKIPSSDEKNRPFISFDQAIKKLLSMKSACGVFEVYNAINICDVVIINYTSNLAESLKEINGLCAKGVAKKTLSLVCFPLGKIETETDRNDFISKLFFNHEYISFRQEGSIRDQRKYEYYVQELEKALNAEKEIKAKKGKKGKNAQKDEQVEKVKIEDKIIFGQSDFTIQIPTKDSGSISRFFHFLFNNHQMISQACWEIHTELLYLPKTDNSKIVNPAANTSKSEQSNNNDNDPFDILGEIYRKYSELSDCSDIRALPWYDAFYELLGVHANIDRDPVLHGPGYLIYRYVEILYDYLEKAFVKNSVPEESTKLKTIINDNSENFEITNRGLTNLTDQVLRIDDLIFHGFANSSSLYDTLPECVVDFYHAMLVRVVEFVYKHDIFFYVSDQHIQKDTFEKYFNNYRYDFLLLPDVTQTIKIKELFVIKNYDEMAHRRLGITNPEKQVYLVSFSVPHIFSPLDFFVRLVHECFHYFGDRCRLRKKRAKFLTQFVAELIVFQGFSDFSDNIKKTIKEQIASALDVKFSNEIEPNGERSREIIRDGIEECLSNDGLLKLRTITKHAPVLYKGHLDKLSMDENLLFYSLFFFQEGYADLMTILLLKLTPKQYFDLFKDDQQKPEDFIITAQRIAIVAAALANTGVWLKKTIEDEFQVTFKAKFGTPENCSEKRDFYLHEYMSAYFDALASKSDYSTKECSKFKECRENDVCHITKLKTETFPVSCTNKVVEYLEAVKNSFVECYENKPEGEEPPEQWITAEIDNIPKLDDIRENFDMFFVNGQLFTTDFFEVINKEHEAVRTLIKPKTPQQQNTTNTKMSFGMMCKEIRKTVKAYLGQKQGKETTQQPEK